jgi:hypothetical protein
MRVTAPNRKNASLQAGHVSRGTPLFPGSACRRFEGVKISAQSLAQVTLNDSCSTWNLFRGASMIPEKQCSTWNLGLPWETSASLIHVPRGTWAWAGVRAVSRGTHQAPEFLNSRPTDDGIPLLQEKCQIRANRRSTWNVEPIRGEND